MARFIVDIDMSNSEATEAKELSRTLSDYLLAFNNGVNTVLCVETNNHLQFYEPTERRTETYEGAYIYVTVADPNENIEIGEMFTSVSNVNPNGSLILCNEVRLWNEQDNTDLGQAGYVKILPYDKQ